MEHETLHGQILRSLGTLEGKTDAGFAAITQRSEKTGDPIIYFE